MTIAEVFDLVTIWMFRIGLVIIAVGIVFWLATFFVKLIAPPSGVALPAVEIVGGNRSGQGPMLTHLFGAQLRHIRDEFTRSVRVLNDNLATWQSQLAEQLAKEETEAGKARAIAVAPNSVALTVSKTTPPQIPPAFDPATLEESLKSLKTFADSLESTKAPEIRVSGVDLGSLLQWLADRLLPKSPYSLMLVEDGSRAAMLVSGPLFGDGIVNIDLGVSNSPLSPKEVVEPVAYHVLATSLRKLPKNPINLGEWDTLRHFVRGVTGFAEVASSPEPILPAAIATRKEQRAHIIAELLEAAEKIRIKRPDTARDIVSFAAFFASQSGDYDREADILDRNAALFADKAADLLKLRTNLARRRALDRAVNEAARTGAPGSGAGARAAAAKLLSEPSMVAALKRHRLRGGSSETTGSSVAVAILGSTPPAWLGLSTTPPRLSTEKNFMSTYVGGIAQILQTLTPHASLSFIPVGDETDQSRGAAGEANTIGALEAAARSNAQIVIIPLGPLRGNGVATALQGLVGAGKLVILAAGNDGVRGEKATELPTLATKVLFATSIRPDGTLSDFTNVPAGALAVVGENLPHVALEGERARIEHQSGTGPATAVLAAVAVEAKVRYPDLPMADMAQVLLAAATQDPASGVPIAVVP